MPIPPRRYLVCTIRFDVIHQLFLIDHIFKPSYIQTYFKWKLALPSLGQSKFGPKKEK